MEGSCRLTWMGMVRSAVALALSKCSECQNQQGFGYSLGKKKHCLGEEPQ